MNAPFDVQAFWSRKGLFNFLLLPFSLLFVMAVLLRRNLYRWGVLSSDHPGVPVIVVGNLTVGGSGKTPFVIWLVEWLKSQGRSPGVVSRGYGRRNNGLCSVSADSTADEVGDEPLLIHDKTGVPVVVGADRLAAARLLHASHLEVDVIVSDDGLQHYRLQRDMELVLADARSLFGNGWLLPAGPLREPVSRLGKSNALILSQRDDVTSDVKASVPVFSVRHEPAGFRKLASGEFVELLPVSGDRQIQAVAAIARPGNFLASLKKLGINFRSSLFADHHLFTEGDIDRDAVVVMTEKDAVKCKSFVGPEWWALELRVMPSQNLEEWMKGELARF